MCCECYNPKENPRICCAVSSCCSIIVITTVFLSIFYSPPSSKRDDPRTDSPLLLNSKYDYFEVGPIIHRFMLNADDYPNSYGAIVYVINKGVNNFKILVNFTLQNTTAQTGCGGFSNPYSGPLQFMCTIHPTHDYFPNGTNITVTLYDCEGSSCSSSTSLALLSVKPLSTNIKYAIQTSFDQSYTFAIGITRNHYFSIDTRDIDSFQLNLYDQDSYGFDDCDGTISYPRCIYVAPSSNISFVNNLTAEYSNCHYYCHKDGGSYFLETLDIDVSDGIDEYLVTIYVDAASVDSTDFVVIGTNLELYMVSHRWWYLLMAIGSALIAGLVCILPGCFYWWRGVVKVTLRNRKFGKQKRKFVKQWNSFYLQRFELLMSIFGERGLVELIQSYLDDLDIIPELKDDHIFAMYYTERYNFDAKDIDLKRPLLINN